MNNIFDKFTDDAKRVLGIAQSVAKESGYNYIGSEHVLLAMTIEDTNLSKILTDVNVTRVNVSEKVQDLVGPGDFNINSEFGYTPRTKKIIEGSFTEAKNLGQSYVAPEHLLLAIISEGESIAVAVLQELDVNLDNLRAMLLQSNSSGDKAKKGSGKTPTLDKFGVDLTEQARNGELDPVIGREKEVERITQILSRRTKNNPILIGEPGVGKSAIAEELAQKLEEDNVPEVLKDRRLIMLDLASMLAGAKYRGEFEERLKAAINEVTENKNIILFIDEIHTLIGTGASEGSMDAANILKPSLARGELQLIGATTLDEYKKNIEKDAALERRFQPVTVGEPSPDEAIEILKGLRDKYEAHHKVKITDKAIESAVRLSDRYISDRYLPDKAIDVMDEAASKVRIGSSMTPPEIKELEMKINELKKEKQAAIDNQDFEKAAKFRDEERELSDKMDGMHKQRIGGKNSPEDPEVDEEDIAGIVSGWTGIPVVEITEDESERLLNLEAILHERVIGQEEAVSAVSKAIRRARAGLKSPSRPIGSFIFLGPTGVGKTELSKALAHAMFGDENAMIRLDMSEYMEQHTVSKLIGSPPGYVGYDEGGQLTEHVRRKPYSVLLFDEIEKAHPDVFNVLLQILDDGRLTDGQGRTVDFKNTVIILTSNVGAGNMDSKTMGFGSKEEKAEFEKTKQNMLDSLKREFRPEFLNRVDDIIVFHPLTKEEIRQIVNILVNQLGNVLSEREVKIDVDDAAKDWLAEKGYDKEYGARPLRRTIQHEIEDKLSEMILDKSLNFGQTVKISEKDDALTFNVVKEKATV